MIAAPIAPRFKLTIAKGDFMIGRNADHRHDDYYFRRTETPERKQLMFERDEPAWKSIAAGVCIMFFLAILVVVTR